MLNNVLLVTRNYRGQCEMNFISTVDEFVSQYAEQDAAYCSGYFKQVVEKAKPFEWAISYYTAGSDSYDLRLCQGPEDLLRFLAGKYNDTIEQLEHRNPGCAGFYNSWIWENRADLCSVLAVEAVKDFIEERTSTSQSFAQRLSSLMPDFPFNYNKQDKALPLDAVIFKINRRRQAQIVDSRPSFVPER